MQLLLLNRVKARWSENRAAQGFHFINSFISNFFGPNSKMCTCKVCAAWGHVSRGLTVFTWNLKSILSALELLRHQQSSATNSDCPIVWLLLLPLKIGHMIFKRPIHQLKSSMTKKLTKYLISLACTYCPFHQPKTPREPDTRLLITAGFHPSEFWEYVQANSKFQIIWKDKHCKYLQGGITVIHRKRRKTWKCTWKNL